MSVIMNTASRENGISIFIRRHPLVSYFGLSYAGMWIVIAPLVMDSFGWIRRSDSASLLLFVLSSLCGPTLATYWVTSTLEGRRGMRQLFRRTFQVRVGLQWYTVALFIFLAIWLGAYSFRYRGAPVSNLAANPALLPSASLPNVSMGLLIPSLGEEPGWRGFALPPRSCSVTPASTACSVMV